MAANSRTVECGRIENGHALKKAVDIEGALCIAGIILFFLTLGSKMGLINCVNTMLNTAYQLLMGTVLYIMAVAVIAGALSGLLSEFGVIAIANRLLSPLMRPLYGLPGAGVVGVLTTYLSDNPAILSLCDDERFCRYFKKYQLPALCNLGTSFGMGMIITVFMMALPVHGGESYIAAAIIGNIGATLGSIVSVRLMMLRTKREFGVEQPAGDGSAVDYDILRYREVREGSIMERMMGSMLDGGASGVKVGLSIIPGVLVVCTIIMMLTNGAPVGGVYTGAAFEGIALLPWIGERLSFILTPLFGFTSPGNIAVPFTALGAAAAAMGLVPQMVRDGLAGGGDIAVFTAMCMCWSGYLSTHISMMDSLGCRKLAGSAILCHTVGGLFAGISANWIYQLIM